MKRSKFLKILGLVAVAPIAIAKALEGNELISKPVFDKEAYKCVTLKDGTKVYYLNWEGLDDPNPNLLTDPPKDGYTWCEYEEKRTEALFNLRYNNFINKGSGKID